MDGDRGGLVPVRRLLPGDAARSDAADGVKLIGNGGGGGPGGGGGGGGAACGSAARGDSAGSGEAGAASEPLDRGTGGIRFTKEGKLANEKSVGERRARAGDENAAKL